MCLQLHVSSFSRAAIFLGLVALWPTGAAGQRKGAVSNPPASGGVQPPVVGFVTQDALRLRPVVGAVGAAVLGDSYTLPESIKRLSVSPAGSFAIAESTEDRPVSVLPIGTEGVGVPVAVSGAFSHADCVEFSVSGSTVALYSASAQRIQIVTNLPGSASVQQEFDVSSLSMPFTAMAVSDDGTTVLAGVSSGQSGAVYRLSAGSAIENVLSAASPSALRFLPQTDSALLADSALNQILLLRELSGTVAVKVLAGPEEGANGPNQIEVLADNRTIVVGNAGANSLLLIDVLRGTTTVLPTFAPVSAMRTVKMRSGVALATEGPPAYWLFGGEPAHPVLTLIADPAAVANQQ